MAARNKARVHREWIMPLRKRSCPCGEKKVEVFALGEYRAARWRTVEHFCRSCFPALASRLSNHLRQCGCSFEFVMRSGYKRMPDFIMIPIEMCQQPETNAPINRSAEAYPSIQDKQAVDFIQQSSAWEQLSLSAGNIEISLGRQ